MPRLAAAYRVFFYAEGSKEPAGGFLSLTRITRVEATPAAIELSEGVTLAVNARGERVLHVDGRELGIESALLSGAVQFVKKREV